MSKRVKILGSMSSADAALLPGDIVDLDEHVADAWISDGNAQLVDPNTPVTAFWYSSSALEKEQAEKAAAEAAAAAEAKAHAEAEAEKAEEPSSEPPAGQE